MSTDREMQRIVNNTKIIINAIDDYQLAHNEGGKIEILLWFWTMCARDVKTADNKQLHQLEEKILHIIHSAIEESGDHEEFIEEHYYLYEQRVAIYEDIDKWSERLYLLCQWAQYHDYKDGIIGGKLQIDVLQNGDIFRKLEAESRLQNFMKRAIADISLNMTQYLKNYLQAQNIDEATKGDTTPSEKTNEEKKLGGVWALILTLSLLLWAPWRMNDEGINQFLTNSLVVEKGMTIELFSTLSAVITCLYIVLCIFIARRFSKWVATKIKRTLHMYLLAIGAFSLLVGYTAIETGIHREEAAKIRTEKERLIKEEEKRKEEEFIRRHLNR